MRLSTPLWTQLKLAMYLAQNPMHVEWLGECPCGCGDWYVGTIRYGNVKVSRRGYEFLERHLR